MPAAALASGAALRSAPSFTILAAVGSAVLEGSLLEALQESALRTSAQARAAPLSLSSHLSLDYR